MSVRGSATKDLPEMRRVRSVAGRVIARLPGGHRLLARRRARRAPEKVPALSVIVPVYNVEPYLEECLDSLLSQSYRDIEVILVDDGSTDNSPGICQDYMTRDRRIRYVRRRNGGLGRARNTGIKEAKGRYIAFVDSDDTIPPDAFKDMMSCLKRTGSDMVIGAMTRFGLGKTWMPDWVKRVHRCDLEGITIIDHPELFLHVFACAKIFRRDFFDSVCKFFPEGIRYEDQEVAVRAYLGAHKIDVLQRSVYNWRKRPDRSSITQQKHTLEDLRDRLAVIDATDSMIASSGSSVLREYWYGKTFGLDLVPYYRAVPRARPEFWDVLSSGVARQMQRMTPEDFRRVNVTGRLLTYLVAEGRRQDVLAALTRMAEIGGRFRAAQEHGALTIVEIAGLAPGDDIPNWVFDFRQADMSLSACLHGWELQQSGTVLVKGYALVPGLDPDMVTTTVVLLPADLRSEDTQVGDRIELPIRPSIPERSMVESDWYQEYPGASFEAELDLTRIPFDRFDRWRAEVQVTAGKYSSSGPFSLAKGATRGFFDLPEIDAGGRPIVGFEARDGLVVTFSRPRVFVDDIRQAGEVVEVHFRCAETPLGVEEMMTDRAGMPLAPVELGQEPGTYRARWSLADVQLQDPDAPRRSGVVKVRMDNGRRRMLAWTGSRSDFDSRVGSASGVHMELSKAGYIRLAAEQMWIVADAARLDATDRTLTLEGTWTSIDSEREVPVRSSDVVLVGATQRILASAIEWSASSERFAVRFDLAGHMWGDPSLMPRCGAYRIVMNRPRSDGATFEVPLTAGSTRGGMAEASMGGTRVSVDVAPATGRVVLSVRTDYAPDERGRFCQGELQRSYRSSQPALRPGVVFETYHGQSASDSALALFREARRRNPDIPYYWSVREPSVLVPDGAIRLQMYTRDWYEALATCSLLVNNSNFPFYFRKRSGQTYIQTWHGTPLKKIGNDVPPENLSLPYRALMRREAEEYWDALLAQNPFSAEVLPRAFGYSGEVCALGYPRNDSLVDGCAAEAAAGLRDWLGIGPDAKVVLYAPTWRDSVVDARGRYKLVTYLDVEETTRSLGPNWHVLVRGHSNTAKSRTTIGGERVHDVTDYPDVTDLMAASDVLVTDYSSIMFDYAVTRRPTILLAPDIEEYSTVTRGFYFDIRAESPGPIVGTTAEVVELLADLDALTTDFGPARDHFRDRFAPMDDGKAAARVYEAIWPENLRG